jgi:hypothetical protein
MQASDDPAPACEDARVPYARAQTSAFNMYEYVNALAVKGFYFAQRVLVRRGTPIRSVFQSSDILKQFGSGLGGRDHWQSVFVVHGDLLI